MRYTIRPAEIADRNFICDAWVRSYQHSNTAGSISGDRWFSVMLPEVARILDDRVDARTLVAADGSDLYGFATVDTNCRIPVVFYVYVKSAYRKLGMARRLLCEAGITGSFVFTHATPHSAVLTKLRKLPLARWKPKIARFPKEDPRGSG